ncbi:MAG: tRNA uridine-5-carboxymethylaminomethyl(34) synthesis GTPase MnmE [Cycloclasticus sp.]|nr:tRNA uridine-5-carboxymethylaminomethyl(34) synthesis GTPase MnmE [Cycloclasticus sp.]MBQ0790165.1 tRNA uridine-5-carboxymethylaminomethyl(34) synthesis GTPase MnmE [Cycloclasticus sp.]
MSNETDTIAAIATASGRGGIGIIRVSGAKTRQIARAIIGTQLDPRKAYHKPFKAQDGSTIDTGLALYFQSPASYTGEDTLELQGHGGPVVMDMLLRRTVELGARLARAGEFTERAFLNEKLDLTQAEAVADVIDAGTEQAVKSAQRSLQGEFSSHINTLQEAITQIRLYVESAIDFSDEDIDFLASDELAKKQQRVQQLFLQIQRVAKQGSLLREGITVVLAGSPNAGKSSLLNALTERDTAIVTNVPGTTRDTLKEQIQLDGMPLHIIDTAGLRETVDVVEQEGVKRAHKAIQSADRVLLVIDDRERETVSLEQRLIDIPKTIPVTVVFNKIDLTGAPAGLFSDRDVPEINLSIKNATGLDALRNHLKQIVGFEAGDQGVFMARRRHLDALKRADTLYTEGTRQFIEHQAGELFAEDLRQVQNALSEITGSMSADDLLGEIFSSFCIGK